MGPFRWVKSYAPIFESYLAPLNQGPYSPITRAEVGPAWAGIAFWLSCFGQNCAQMAPGGAETNLFNFQCVKISISDYFGITLISGAENGFC